MTKYSSDVVKPGTDTIKSAPTNANLQTSDVISKKQADNSLDTIQLSAKAPKNIPTNTVSKLSDTVLKGHTDNSLETANISADTQKILQTSDDFRFSDPILKEHIEMVTESSHDQNTLSSDKNSWLLGILFISLILLALAKFYHNKYLSKMINAIFNYQASFSLFNEKSAANLRGSATINLIFFVNTAIFLVEVIQYNEIDIIPLKDLQLFFLCLISLVVIYSIKTIVFGIIGRVFNGNSESREYIHNVFIYNKNLGLFLSPIIMGVPFIMPYAIPILLNIGIFLIGFFYILRLFRGLTILFRKHVSIFYMILYLCILELLPLLMLYKSLTLFT